MPLWLTRGTERAWARLFRGRGERLFCVAQAVREGVQRGFSVNGAATPDASAKKQDYGESRKGTRKERRAGGGRKKGKAWGYLLVRLSGLREKETQGRSAQEVEGGAIMTVTVIGHDEFLALWVDAQAVA